VQTLYMHNFEGKLCVLLLTPIGILGVLQQSTLLVLALRASSSYALQLHFGKVSRGQSFIALYLMTDTSLLDIHLGTLVHGLSIWHTAFSCAS
jgi:hypothetical protein